MRVKLELPDPERKPGEMVWKTVDMPGAPQRGDFIQWDGVDLAVMDVMWIPQDELADILVVCAL